MLYTILNVLGDVLGGIFISFVALFAVLGLVYKIWGRSAESVVEEEGMPLLRPIPIPTKKVKGLMRVLVWLFEVRRWSLGEVWSRDLHDGTRNVTFVFHKGFKFDGASIPRIFWFLLSPVGLLLIPGLVHDYAYKYNQLWEIDDGVVKPYFKGGGKSRWDRLFLAAGEQINGLHILNAIAWSAVVIGGRGAWKQRRGEGAEAPIPVVKHFEASAGGAGT